MDTPSALVRHLDQYVIGQDDAKKTIAVAVHTHYRKVDKGQRDGADLTKSNVLLIGPTGTGKTLLCETLSRRLGVPFVTASATSLAQTRFVNDEIEAILQRLVDKAQGDIDRAERGIVFIDEIDKLRKTGEAAGGSSGESVQHALLKIMEGAPVKLAAGRHLNTASILFICGGAFVGLDNIMAQSHGFGFIGAGGGDSQAILDRLNRRVKPTDLFAFGLIPEFTGRLPIVANFGSLDRVALARILTEPRDSLANQFRDLLAAAGVELAIYPRVFEQIAELAFEYKTGARSLRGVFEEMMTPILYVLPDHPEIGRVEIASLFSPPRLLPRAQQPAG